MKSKALDATTTRWILVGIIVLLVCGGVAGAWQLQMILNEKTDCNKPSQSRRHK